MNNKKEEKKQVPHKLNPEKQVNEASPKSPPKKESPKLKPVVKCVGITTHGCNMGGRQYDFKKGEEFDVFYAEDLERLLENNLAVELGGETDRRVIKKKPSHL